MFSLSLPVRRFTDASTRGQMTRYQPFLCMCHRKSSKRAAENMPCAILTPLACPRTSRNRAGSLRVQGKGHSGLWPAGHQGALLSDSFKHGGSCGEQCWTVAPVIHSCLSKREDWWQLAFIQGLTGYKLFSHYYSIFIIYLGYIITTTSNYYIVQGSRLRIYF